MDKSGTAWQICEDVTILDGVGRIVVMRLGAPDHPQALLGTGAAIWEALMGDQVEEHPVLTEQELLAGLAERYQTLPELIAADVEAFLTGMLEAGYVRRLPGEEA